MVSRLSLGEIQVDAFALAAPSSPSSYRRWERLDGNRWLIRTEIGKPKIGMVNNHW